jgi:hypothetical protein
MHQDMFKSPNINIQNNCWTAEDTFLSCCHWSDSSQKQFISVILWRQHVAFLSKISKYYRGLRQDFRGQKRAVVWASVWAAERWWPWFRPNACSLLQEEGFFLIEDIFLKVIFSLFQYFCSSFYPSFWWPGSMSKTKNIKIILDETAMFPSHKMTNQNQFWGESD